MFKLDSLLFFQANWNWKGDCIADGIMLFLSFLLFPRNIQEDVSVDAEMSHGDTQNSGENPSAGNVEVADTELRAVRGICCGPFLGSKLQAVVKKGNHIEFYLHYVNDLDF